MVSSRMPTSILAMPLLRPMTFSLVAKNGMSSGRRTFISNSSSSTNSLSTITATNLLNVRSRFLPLQAPFLLRQQQQQQQQRRTMAKMSIIGRLTAAPEMMTTVSGQECVRYTIAKGHGKDKYPSFFRVMMFEEGKDREILLALPKGSLVFVEASAKLRQYTDSDGSLKTSLGLVQRNLLTILKHRPIDPEQAKQEQHNANVMASQRERSGDGNSEYGSIADIEGEGERDEYGDGVAPGVQTGPGR